MSLILEALKKSEQQRRVGQVPDLGTPILVTRRRRNLLPIVVVLIVAAIAFGAWLRFSSPAKAPPTATTQSSETGSPVSEPADSASTGSETGQTASGQRAKSPEALLGRPLSAYEKERLKLTGSLPPSALTDKPIPPSTTAPPSSGFIPPPAARRDAPPATPAPVTPPPTSADMSVAAPLAPTPPPSTTAPDATTAPVTPAPATPAPTAPPKTGSAQLPAVPYLWELPYATRKDMPPLQISMHVYADQPANRFVVIDGESYREGDSVADGLMVKEIRPDGVVLDASGKLFLLPAGAR